MFYGVPRIKPKAMKRQAFIGTSLAVLFALYKHFLPHRINESNAASGRLVSTYSKVQANFKS